MRASFTSLFLSLFLLVSCQQQNASSLLPLELDSPRAERALSFYFGSYTTMAPNEAGLLHMEDGQTFVNLKVLREMGLSQNLEDINGDGVIDWDELEPFLAATYYEARSFPQTLDALYDQISTPHPDSGWMAIDIDGMMVSARRTVLVKESDVEEALLRYKEHNEDILYPVGTTFIGNHYEGDRLVETTVSQKRKDQFWDFFIYDQEGRLTSSTQTGPKQLTAPTRCVGCHFGTKLFEPEASFPDNATDGPFGPRGIYVEEAGKNRELAERLDEHQRRSDTILGVYATIYASRIQSRLDSGEALTGEERAVLDQLKP